MKTMPIRSGLALLVVALASACSGGERGSAERADVVLPPEAKRLSGAEISERFAGAQARGQTDRGAWYTVRYRPDGSQTFRIDNDGFSDVGRWSVDNDRYCAEWENIRAGERGCWEVYELGGNRYVLMGTGSVPDYDIALTR